MQFGMHFGTERGGEPGHRLTPEFAASSLSVTCAARNTGGSWCGGRALACSTCSVALKQQDAVCSFSKSLLNKKQIETYQGIGIGIFNDNVDENQSATNHHGMHFSFCE